MLPIDELTRLARLKALELLDTPPEPVFDDAVRLASRLCETPVSLVSLVDADRQWFKARRGLELSETPREYAFCARTIESDEPYVVEDARADPRLSDNPLVTGGPRIRFYAGVPLAVGGARIGTLCVIDSAPRRLAPAALDSLCLVARQLMVVLELRDALARAEELRGRERAQREREFQRELDDAQRRARALNEGIAQDLAGARLLLDGVQAEPSLGAAARARLERVADLLGDTLEECRTLAGDEGALTLRDGGLGPALHALALRAGATPGHSLRREPAIGRGARADAPLAWQHQVLRVADSALREAAGGGPATGAVLDVALGPAQATVTVCHAPGRTEGYGRESLRFRVAQLGGAVSVAPHEAGVRVEARIPRPGGR